MVHGSGNPEPRTQNPEPQNLMFLTRLRIYTSFVRFSHSVFALPFALAGALLAARRATVSWTAIGWILRAMVGARSGAMGFNRLADARLDALNPRTANRELPRGAMSRREAAWFVVFASVIFMGAAWRLSPLCLALSPVALAIVFWYSLAKRYTTWTQMFLGLAMAVAPVGGWLAAGGRGGGGAGLLGIAVGPWGGGFGIFYAWPELAVGRGHRPPSNSGRLRGPRAPFISLAVAITGASGAVYATRTLAALLSRAVHVELVVSDYGRRLLRDELGEDASVERLMPYLSSKYGAGVSAGSIVLHSNRDLGATIASGSHGCRGMAIVPCSMKTLAGVAHGLSRNLVERAADVMLKEQRRLVIVPRETPMSLPQLRNMVLCAEAGAMILPAMPAFYQQPKTIDDLADFVAGKILSALGFDHDLYQPWTGKAGSE